VYNLNSAIVIGNMSPCHPHIYVMKDGTFKFEDETNCLSDESYNTFREVKDAFYKYAAELCTIEKVGPVEGGRRLFLADCMRGLRTTINHLIHSKDNADFHKKNLDAMDAAGKIADGLDAYARLLDPHYERLLNRENVPF